MVSNEIMKSQIQVRSRISCDGECGTVKYVGEIECQEGVWIGIEWDNPSRGKHSGTYKSVKYFETSNPNGGSFIRPLKAETGISCPEAVKRKYGKGSDGQQAALFNLPQKSGKLRCVEMVGFQKVMGKQSQFHKLTEVVVSQMLVSDPGDVGEMGELVPCTQILDLSCNLLPSWASIAAIAEQLPQLKCLVLSKNRLSIENCMERYKESFSGTITLVLNCMTYSWTDVLACGEAWPYAENLYLCDNVITSLETPSNPLFSKLRSLSLERNLIRSWEEIAKLGEISNLEELYLDNTELEFIEFTDVPPTKKTELFPNLTSLSIRSNKLSRWQDISELNKLRSLKELKITNNPVILSVIPETARQLVIVKISGLQVLNRTEIEKSERRGAGIDYIKRFHTEWIAHGGQKDLNKSKPSLEFLMEHPTYMELLQKHGGAEDSEVVSVKPLLKNNLISVEIFSLQTPDKLPVKKRLPVTMPLCKVKGLIQRIFHIPAQDIQLTCLHSDGNERETEMDNDFRELSFFSVSDGDKIKVKW